MAYTGNIPAEQYTSTVKDTFNGDNSTTDFTLSRPSLANNLEVFVENVQQEPTTAYTVSGTTISFTSAPPTGTGNIYVIHRGQAVQTVVPPAGISVNATDLTVTGASALQDGLTVDNDGATVATFDRATSDGDIAVFQKDGTAIGSVGVDNGDNVFIQGNSTHSGLNFGTNEILPYKNGAITADTIALGSGTNRYTDLYLSGGVYLGGTGAANYLDDYETGAWTPALGGSSSAPSGTYNNQQGRYIKIGELVHVIWQVILAAGFTNGSGSVRITGLPFVVATESFSSAGALEQFDSAGADYHLASHLFNNQTYLSYAKMQTSAGWTDLQWSNIASTGNNMYFYGATTYRTTE